MGRLKLGLAGIGCGILGATVYDDPFPSISLTIAVALIIWALIPAEERHDA